MLSNRDTLSKKECFGIPFFIFIFMTKYDNFKKFLSENELTSDQLNELKRIVDQKVKENTPPLQYTQCFYKYTDVRQDKLNLLKKKEIWFPAAKTLNDPFDCRLNFKVDPNNKDHSVPEQKACIEKVSDIVKDYGVLSLTRQIKGTENDGPNSLLTWSHYTNGHKGMCLCFDATEYMKVEHGKDGVPIKNYEYFCKVVYADKYPDMQPFMFMDCTNRDMINDTSFGMLMTKSKDWSYENEWRIIQKDSNKGYPIPGELKAVYFGMNISAEDIKQTLAATAGYTNVEYFIGKKAEQEFKIDFVKLNSMSPQMHADIIQNSLKYKEMDVRVEAILPKRIGVTIKKDGCLSKTYYPFPMLFNNLDYMVELVKVIQSVIDNDAIYSKQLQYIEKIAGILA